MKNKNDNEWRVFVAKMEQLSLPELEVLIKEKYEAFRKNHDYKDPELNLCLSQRKYLINSKFKFTPSVVRHVERVNRILTEGTAKVLDRTKMLYNQMVQLKQKGDGFLDDFDVEGTISVSFNGEESVLLLDEDENNGQSDYIAMADVLNFTALAFEHLREFNFSWNDNPDYPAVNDDSFQDSMLELNWNVEVLSAPELSSIEYFCYASHVLFVDSNYSLSDAIRVNDVWNEVKVTHTNLGERKLTDYHDNTYE